REWIRDRHEKKQSVDGPAQKGMPTNHPPVFFAPAKESLALFLRDATLFDATCVVVRPIQNGTFASVMRTTPFRASRSTARGNRTS
ncbi:MAG TPA: hypothetical protein PLM08_24780, partial [Polyangiaceae bacterium]|nr:hypothetical protein [Polyangiaceae bacterium]